MRGVVFLCMGEALGSVFSRNAKNTPECSQGSRIGALQAVLAESSIIISRFHHQHRRRLHHHRYHRRHHYHHRYHEFIITIKSS